MTHETEVLKRWKFAEGLFNAMGLKNLEPVVDETDKMEMADMVGIIPAPCLR
ncbi:hypothetical protein HDF17_002589 [Granulicella arctica]|uniref:Uncharacterized protein n=1 Tax=Granulicella arctica TaxID=940613 RepID=A0A7Y9PI06_9BACT|nr:hypothetical protein [Granulicella arctica]